MRRSGQRATLVRGQTRARAHTLLNAHTRIKFTMLICLKSNFIVLLSSSSLCLCVRVCHQWIALVVIARQLHLQSASRVAVAIFAHRVARVDLCRVRSRFSFSRAGAAECARVGPRRLPPAALGRCGHNVHRLECAPLVAGKLHSSRNRSVSSARARAVPVCNLLSHALAMHADPIAADAHALA